MTGDDRFDDVAARAAHELASPLNKASAFARILREELPPSALSDEVRATLSHLERAADEAREVVDRFHEWARATRLGPVSEAPLAEVLADAIRALGPRAAGAELERAGAFAPEAGDTVTADVDALRRVLELVLENALLYVAPGGAPRIRITGRRADGRWRLLVDDGGIGVEPAERERVFAPFARLHRRSRYAGVGLGLSIARRAIEARGGRLVLEDSPLGGVRAAVELPG